VFTDSAPFDASFQLTSAGHSVDSAALARAHAMLKLLCLRREKADVELGMPPKRETRVLCPLSQQQTQLYRALLLRHSDVIDAHTQDADVAGAGGVDAHAAARKGDLRRLQNLCMQLRLVCGHPEMLLDDEHAPQDDAPAPSLPEFVAASGKLKVLDRLLARLKPAGNRVVIFSQARSTVAADTCLFACAAWLTHVCFSACAVHADAGHFRGVCGRARLRLHAPGRQHLPRAPRRQHDAGARAACCCVLLHMR
jgi:SWI/SNF-related matrix-associated actin-dependent regulator of chromatin subfamily A member 5